MAREKESKIYSQLPQIYGYIMRKIDYNIWAEYIYSIVNEYLTKKPKILELAAGNCSLAKYFSEFYPQITASDISINMLKENPSITLPKVCCDMTRLPFKSKFDLIYCAFDSVNYLMTRKKLLELFREAYFLLNQNGIFTFDVSLERNSLLHTKMPERKGMYNGIRFKQISEYDKLKRIHKNIFEIKLKSGEIYTESHKQKIYPFETYFELIELAGLFTVECLKAFSFDSGTAESERVQFIVKRSPQNSGE